MSNELESRFFLNDDEKINNLDDFEIPVEWWSRFYEYAWASKFLNKDDTIIDAGCGIEHPFKHYASNRVKKVYAVDINKEISSCENTDTLEHICAEFADMKDHISEKSDTIFCLSVLEHMYPANIVNALKAFNDMLKPNGKIILTCDYPHLGTDTLMNLVNEAGLIFEG